MSRVSSKFAAVLMLSGAMVLGSGAASAQSRAVPRAAQQAVLRAPAAAAADRQVRSDELAEPVQERLARRRRASVGPRRASTEAPQPQTQC